MTKKEVIRVIRMQVYFNKRRKVDLRKLRDAWPDFTERMYKCELITKKQYETWTNPF